jgi:hypothetical protein
MINRNSTFLAFLLSASSAFALPPDYLSESRLPSESWEQASYRQVSRLPSNIQRSLNSPNSAKSSAKYFNGELDPAKVSEWTGTAVELDATFTAARDLAPFSDTKHRDFKRRAPWFYPHDGCAPRAAHLTRRIETKTEIIPDKIFLFGDLELKTPYSRTGIATWWYHTAAAVSFEGEVYILDPAVAFDAPLSLKDWVTHIAPKGANLKLAICDNHAYTAADICMGADATQVSRSKAHIEYFLPYEWSNLEALGFDARALLKPLEN